MEKISSATAFALMFLLMLLSGQTFIIFGSESGTVGVKPGDWVEYKITRYQFSSHAMPMGVKGFRMEVLNVSIGPPEGYSDLYTTPDSPWVTVHYNFTMGYDYSPAGSSNKTYSLITNGAHCNHIICNNSKPGDVMGWFAYYGQNATAVVYYTLNGTVTRVYGGVAREAIYIKYSEYEAPGIHTIERYWDKNTGILLEDNETLSYPSITEVVQTYREVIVDTNLWQMESPHSQISWQYIVPPTVFGVAVAFLVVRHYSKKKGDSVCEKTL